MYPLLPRAALPDTRLQVEAALPEAAAFERRTRPPMVLDIELEGENSQTQGPRRRQSLLTLPQSLYGRIPAIQALASTRPLV